MAVAAVMSFPGLGQRRDDIPLLVRHLLRRARDQTPALVSRFAGPDGEPSVASDLVDHLLQRHYTTHVRELEGALWRAMASSRGTRVALPEDMAAEALARATGPAAPSPGQPSAPTPGQNMVSTSVARREPGEEPTPDEIRACVAGLRGNLVQAAKALGLPSRYALYRLLRKHGIDAEAFRTGGD